MLRIPPLDEPGVAITDFLLAIETCALSVILASRSEHRALPSGRWFIALFSCLTAASLSGGILHGFFNSPARQLHMLFWDASLIAIGGTALSCFNIAADLLPTLKKHARAILLISGLAFAVYTCYVLTGYRTFLTAIAFYLPATVLLLIAIARLHKTEKSSTTLQGISGLVLTFVAAAVQQLQFYVEPYLLNHNTIYHLVQGLALFLLFKFSRAHCRVINEPSR